MYGMLLNIFFQKNSTQHFLKKTINHNFIFIFILFYFILFYFILFYFYFILFLFYFKIKYIFGLIFL
jgi:hypothetical protein